MVFINFLAMKVGDGVTAIVDPSWARWVYAGLRVRTVIYDEWCPDARASRKTALWRERVVLSSTPSKDR